jgi:energy-coupling factor transporter transmembrane protein EcfT
MLHTIKPEIKTILFFAIYALLTYISEKAAPSGVCTPGAGFLLFLLSIPISIIYSLVLFYKYNKSENKEYLNCIYIVSGIWVLLFLILRYAH